MHSASILNLKPYLIINSKTVNLSNVSTSIKLKFFMTWMLTKKTFVQFDSGSFIELCLWGLHLETVDNG